MFIAGNVNPTIEGLRLTGGDASGLGGIYGQDAGGGLYLNASEAQVSTMIIFSNTSKYGAGTFLFDSNSTIAKTTIVSNTASADGGGMAIYRSDDASITGNKFSRNVAYSGGGLYLVASDARISHNIIEDNTAALGYGGGLWLVDYSEATLADNAIVHNHAGSMGGGIGLDESSIMIEGNHIFDNTADQNGGGLFINFGEATLTR